MGWTGLGQLESCLYPLVTQIKNKGFWDRDSKEDKALALQAADPSLFSQAPDHQTRSKSSTLSGVAPKAKDDTNEKPRMSFSAFGLRPEIYLIKTGFKGGALPPSHSKSGLSPFGARVELG